MTKPRIGNLRSYLAGTGATGALIAAAVVAFLTLGAIVAFNGFPLGGGDAEGSVSLADQPGGIAPEAAAAALAPAPGAVAARPAGGTVLAAVLPGGTGVGPGGAPTGGGAPGSTPPGGTDTVGGGPVPTSGGGSTGAVGGIVNDVDQSTSGLGLDAPLGGAVGPVADQVDQTGNQTLNDVGGAVGQPNLGDDVGNGVRGLSDRLLGGN